MEGGPEVANPTTGLAESEADRLNRNFLELLQEVRVAQTGVQVLFAFLLAVPFTNGFDDVTGFQRSVYFATLAFTTVSSVLLIAPTAHHRLEFRRQEKERIVMEANRLAIAGLTFLALAMVGVVVLISDVLYGTAAVATAGAVAALMFAWVWFGIPLLRWRRAR